jgi:hypothetical protein
MAAAQDGAVATAVKACIRADAARQGDAPVMAVNVWVPAP